MIHALGCVIPRRSGSSAIPPRADARRPYNRAPNRTAVCRLSTCHDRAAVAWAALAQLGAISSVGRAPRLHRGCRQFEPVIAHQILRINTRLGGGCRKISQAIARAEAGRGASDRRFQGKIPSDSEGAPLATAPPFRRRKTSQAIARTSVMERCRHPIRGAARHRPLPLPHWPRRLVTVAPVPQRSRRAPPRVRRCAVRPTAPAHSHLGMAR